MNTISLIRGLSCAALLVAAGSTAAFGQVEVVYAIDAHAPGNVKSQVPGLTGATFKNFPRPYRSPNGRRWAVVPTMNGFAGTQDQALLTGVGTTGVIAAQEGVTLDSDGATFAFFTAVSPRVSDDGHWISAVSSGDKIVRGDLGGTVTVLAKSSSSVGAPTDVVFGSAAFSSANYTALGPAFIAGISLAPSGANKMCITGTTATVSMPIDVPTDQAGGTSFVMSSVDANEFWTSDSGTHWMAQGKIANPSTAADSVLVVDGSVKIQEGSALTGMSSTVSTISESFMEGNGDWYCRGSNADSTGWIVKNGVVVARTGTPIVPGSTEQWSLFLDVHGNARGDYVIAGRTSNGDPNKSDVLVVNGRFVAARESDGVDLDGNGQLESNMFLHIFQNRVMFADDGYVYFASRMKPTAASTADITGSASSSSLLRAVACAADMGKQGGVAGADGVLDNNDFIVFIDFFFNSDWRADRGVQGGVAGSDGLFDNNDFIVFIDQFFGGC